MVSLADLTAVGAEIAPDGEFEPVEIGEVETAAAGEFEGGFGDRATGRDDALRGRFEVGGEEDREGIGGYRGAGCGVEPAGEATVGKARVVRTVVSEGPPEGGRVETLRGSDVADGELEVVEAEHGCGSIHGSAQDNRRS